MAKIIRGILPRDEIKKITAGLFSAQFLDGGMSGGQLGNKLKNNTQISPSDPQYREFSELVMAASGANEEFNANPFPRSIISPIFSSFKQEQEYKKHVDSALMGPYPGMRTDLSITIFLNDPDAYKVRVLVLETPFGEHKYKLPAGDAILHPTHHVHHVKRITKGLRLAAVTWIESMIQIRKT